MINLDTAKLVAEGILPDRDLTSEMAISREVLRSGEGDILSALVILGRRGGKADANLIEIYLAPIHNQVISSVAFKQLVRHLGLIEQYAPLIRKLILEGDENGRYWLDARTDAIELAKEYLISRPDNEVGCALLGIMLNDSDLDRSSARHALVRILELETALADPFAFRFSQDDPDTNVIATKAMGRFMCRPSN